MSRATLDDFNFIGICLECFFYGLYSGIFAMYFQYQASNKETNKTLNVIFYSISALYVLSIVLLVFDLFLSINPSLSPRWTVLTQTSLFACCDFIAQFILIYRCWIVWGYNIRVVIIPTMLAFAFLGTWLACNILVYILSQQPGAMPLELPLGLTGLALSLTVNALVTGLIVFRIFKVFREVNGTSDDQILGASGGNRSKLRGIIFILIESGMALLSIQLARLVVSIFPTHAASKALNIISGIHEMLNGITPTIILVRTSMGLSFYDEKSMEEITIESLRFGSNHQNSVSEMGSIGIVGHDSSRRNDDDIGIQQSNEIELVER